MSYLHEFFTNNDNFLNIKTMFCIIIMFLIFITDYITSIAINILGGKELNPLMSYFVTHPFIFAFIKIFAAMSIIILSKIIYDILQTYSKNEYNIRFVYITLLVPSILTSFVVINNFMVLLS